VELVALRPPEGYGDVLSYGFIYRITESRLCKGTLSHKGVVTVNFPAGCNEHQLLS